MAVTRFSLSKAPAALLAAASLVGGVSLYASSPASAVTVTLEATDTGNYSDSDIFPPDPADTSYIAGYYDLLDPGSGQEVDVIFRDFFVFDLPAADPAKTLKGVTMRARNYEVRNGAYPEQIISIHGVLGSISNLVTGNASFNDLGQGPTYSAVAFTGSEPADGFSSYNFDPAGVALVKAALGGQIAFSGRNSKEQGGGIVGVFVYGQSEHSAQNPSVFLDLEYAGPNPSVPGPLPLFGAAAAWNWSRRLRTQNRMRGSSRATTRSTATVTSTTSAATTTTIP